MNPNIILIGFMGCGKSTLGRRLAGRLGHEFLDSDDIVTAKTGKSIAQIFSDEGETHFRELETEALRGLAAARGIVLATGGGAVLREENRTLLKNLGKVVWLHADPDTLFERASRSGRRPLLEVENPRSSFNSLLESRLPVYRATANLELDATGLSHEQVLEKLLRALDGWTAEIPAPQN